ncbi:hypothetical protein Hanom_Chr11g01039581 [Helianthus anomalus]
MVVAYDGAIQRKTGERERPREERDGGNLRRSETRTAGRYLTGGRFCYSVVFALDRRFSDDDTLKMSGDGDSVSGLFKLHSSLRFNMFMYRVLVSGTVVLIRGSGSE